MTVEWENFAEMTRDTGPVQKNQDDPLEPLVLGKEHRVEKPGPTRKGFTGGKRKINASGSSMEVGMRVE